MSGKWLSFYLGLNELMDGLVYIQNPDSILTAFTIILASEILLN